MRKVKSNFLLLEVMIAFSLLAIVLGTLFFWYHKMVQDKKERDKQLRPLLEERYCDLRLERILPKIKKDLFFMNNGELYFVFDHGTKQEPLLSDAVVGSLYLDKKEKALCLTIWPHPKFLKKEPSQTWVLLHGATELDFAFYQPPFSKHIVDPEKVSTVTPSKGWQSQWLKEYETIPAQVKINVIRNHHRLEFVFRIEEGKVPIIYGRS